MLPRIVIAGVIFFWMLMNGALVRLWLNPSTSEILTIPVEHVGRQIFFHEQPSNLVIFQGDKRVGGLMIQPQRFNSDGIGTVVFTGNILLQLPFSSQQPFSWRGTAQMNRQFELENLKIHIDARVPKIATEIDLDPRRKQVSFAIHEEGREPAEATFALDENGFHSALKAFGIDPATLTNLASSAKDAASPGSKLMFSARQTQVAIHGERVQAFHLLLRQSTSPMVEADISQLGQILGVKTAFGFRLSPED